MEDDDNHSGDNNEHININKHNNKLVKIMVKKFKIKYTELSGQYMDEEVTEQVIIETDNLNWTLEQFGRNRSVVKYDIKEIKQ